MIRRWRVPIVAAQRVGTDSGRPYAGRWIRQSSAFRCRGSCQLRAAAGGVLAAERRPVRVKQARTACSALGRVHGRVSRAEPSRSCRSGWQVSHKPSELRQLLALMAQLAALTDAVTRLREAQDRAVQAKAARKAAEKLRAASARYARPGAPLMAASPSPVTVVGGRATGPLPPFESDRPGPSAAPHRGPHQSLSARCARHGRRPTGVRFNGLSSPCLSNASGLGFRRGRAGARAVASHDFNLPPGCRCRQGLCALAGRVRRAYGQGRRGEPEVGHIGRTATRSEHPTRAAQR